jgi:hypothetical protein
MRAIQILRNAVAGCALSACALTANAALFEFSNEFSGSGDVCGNVVCATLEVTQVGADVHFTLTADLDPGEFITGLYGNWNPFQFATDHFSFATDGGTTEDSVLSLGAGSNAFQADGDGQFDWLFTFDNAPPSARFVSGEDYTWIFTSADIDDIIGAISENGPVGKNGFTFALRVQGLGTDNEGSGWFNSTTRDETPVPEPGTLVLLALALLLLSGMHGKVFRRS